MQQLIYSIIFGIVQGITEFLPVSSSAHLIISHEIFKIKFDSLIFDVALHFGTLLALLIFFRQKLINYIKIFFNKKTDKRSSFLTAIFFATLPAGFAGLFFEDIIDLYLRNMLVISLTLIIVGILLIIFDKKSEKKIKLENFAFSKIILVGIAQTLALIPGVSRSGITMITGLKLNLNRKSSAELSFLLAIPIIMGASLKKATDINFTTITAAETQTLLIGVLASFISGYIVIKYLMRFLQKRSLAIFGWYRIVLGIFLILFIIFS